MYSRSGQSLGNPYRSRSYPFGAWSRSTFTHGLRRGLYSFAASRLFATLAPSFAAKNRSGNGRLRGIWTEDCVEQSNDLIHRSINIQREAR